MPELRLDEISDIVGGRISVDGRLLGEGERLSLPATAGARGVVRGYSIDTRTLEPGDLFFALRGEARDGHQFVQHACEKGASGAVVAEPREHVARGFVQIVVPSPLGCLQHLAAHVRRASRIPVVAVTGSNGKTTTKEMIAAVLGSTMKVHQSPGNYNNHIGLPLAVLGLGRADEVLVVELGSNHAGEIRHLARIASPDVGVITNVGRAHIGFFGTLEAVAAEKTDLLRSMRPGGRGVVNADDPNLESALGGIGGVVRFGIEKPADVRAEALSLGESGGIAFSVGGVPVRLRSRGRHDVYNALAAIATAGILGIPGRVAARALAGFQPLRMTTTAAGGMTIIDDSYNSNPDSMLAALEVLRSTSGSRRVLVMGDMLELGEESERLHRDTGSAVASAGVDVMVGIGPLTAAAVAGALAGGMRPDTALAFQTKAEAKPHLQKTLKAGDVVLVKGSRLAGLEEVCEFLRQAGVVGRA